MANNIVGKVCAGVITATYLVFMGYLFLFAFADFSYHLMERRRRAMQYMRTERSKDKR